MFRGPRRRRHESQANVRWQAWCGQLTLHGNWECDGSARTAAPSKVCRAYSGCLFMDPYHRPANKTKALALQALQMYLQFMCKRDYASCRIIVLRHGKGAQMHLPRMKFLWFLNSRSVREQNYTYYICENLSNSANIYNHHDVPHVFTREELVPRIPIHTVTIYALT